MHRIVSDGVIRVEIVSITDQADARMAGAVMASRRDAAADGVSQGNELAYWTAKALNAASSGTLLGLRVNGGGLAGAAVIERTLQRPDLYLLGVASLWDAETTEPALLEAAMEFARLAGAPLWAVSHEVQPLGADVVAIDAAGNVLTTATATRRRVLRALG